jgi:hypothetical protein
MNKKYTQKYSDYIRFLILEKRNELTGERGLLKSASVIETSAMIGVAIREQFRQNGNRDSSVERESDQVITYKDCFSDKAVKHSGTMVDEDFSTVCVYFRKRFSWNMQGRFFITRINSC